MRKTLFKGKGLNGIWYKGNIIESSNGECYILQKNSNPIRKGSNGYWDINSPCFQVHPETVCQFTGLLDKNGNKIFDGDTVRWGMNGEEIRVRHAVVEFNPDIQFRITHYINYSGEKEDTDNHVFRFGNFLYKKTENHLEITGNIHDETH